MKKPIPFPTSTAPGTKPQEGAGRIRNGYAEALGSSAANTFVLRRAPGLSNFGTTTRTGCRGFLEVNGELYVGFSGRLERFTSSGGAAVGVGNMTGTKKGFFARNNAATPDKWFVDPDTNIATFTALSVTNSWPDADLPAPNSTCSIDGYGVFTIADGRFFATDLNSTSVNALSFGKAEAKPDGLIRAVPWGDKLMVFGGKSTEVWTNQALSPFPFGRSFVIPKGLAGPYCIAGFEDGFSKPPVWVGDDNAVYQYAGAGEPTKISPPDLDALIEAVSDKTTIEMCAYITRGHAMVQISSATWTRVFDLNTQKWHERDSYGLARSRITQTINAYGKWLCGDTKTGNVQQITATVFKEISDPLRFRIESGPVPDFPYGSVVGRADFNFVTGVGDASGSDPDQTDPTVEISWSDDGGLTYSIPVLRKLGRQSVTEALISLIAETGRTSWMGRRWRIDVADAVYVGFLYATQSDDARAAA